MNQTGHSFKRKHEHAHHRAHHQTSHVRNTPGNETNENPGGNGSMNPCPRPGVQSPRTPGASGASNSRSNNSSRGSERSCSSSRDSGRSTISSQDSERSGYSSYDSHSRYSGDSDDRGNHGNNEAKGDSVLSLQFAYITVILCVLGYVCFFMLKMKQEVVDSCKICDNRVLLEPQNTPVKERSSYNDLVDYASEDYGALIELHDTYHFVEKEFSIGDLLRLPNLEKVSPNAMLKDNDECFAMKGHTGTFIIRLSRPVVVQAITLAHNKQECDAAPREFIMYGIKDPKEKTPVSLGRFQYQNRGKLAQKFIIKSFAEVGFVGLKIESNWGNKQYTCITKIKVHGKPQD